MKNLMTVVLSIVLISFGTALPCYSKIVLRPPKTLNVPSEFASISAALEAAVEGDTIQIAAGTYNENISVLVDNLTIKGAAKDKTIISGDSSSHVITIQRVKRCKIENLTVQNGDIGVVCINHGEVIMNNG